MFRKKKGFLVIFVYEEEVHCKFSCDQIFPESRKQPDPDKIFPRRKNKIIK